ncbi:hypothetical protein [Streptomyces mirabilis]|uniref:hypothetical protein n=1 Tax=Streptomyces mirabilis TaxID=68239 RepID=UPI0036DB77F0
MAVRREAAAPRMGRPSYRPPLQSRQLRRPSARIAQDLQPDPAHPGRAGPVTFLRPAPERQALGVPASAG